MVEITPPTPEEAIDLFIKAVERILEYKRERVDFTNPDIQKGYLAGIDDCLYLFKRARATEDISNG